VSVETSVQTTVTGHYAGPVGRVVALALDLSIAAALFATVSAVVTWIAETVFRTEFATPRSGVGWFAVFVLWLFLYHWVGLATVGKTIGKAVVGLRVVARDGAILSGRRAAIRVIALPISLAMFGLGGIGALIGRERRTLHDVIAGSAVVYEWGGRDARLPSVVSRFLDRRDVTDLSVDS
jgi:uncharacterized RDD family membrane protein YckC